MALQVCLQCSAAYAAGMEVCPQCGATDHRFDWEDDDMARISIAGVSDAGALPGEVGYIEPDEGSEDVSAGSSFSTSDAAPDSNSSGTRTSSDLPSPAPTAENPSSPDPQASPESSSVNTTSGSTPATGRARSRRRASSTESPKDPAATADSPDL